MRVIAHIETTEDLISASVVVKKYIEQGHKESVVYAFENGEYYLVKTTKTGYTVHKQKRSEGES